MTDRFWAPWRMEYILGPKGGPCIFCDFASAPRDAYREKLVLAVQSHALVCLNRYPFASSHLLVAPRRHASDFGSLPLPEYEAMQRLLRETAERLRRATGAEGLNVGFNLGKAAGAGIAEHLHGHVVPRWHGDTNFLPVLADVRIMPEYLDASWQRLAPYFEDLSGDPERPGTG
jgi:ATP adenylyltransferase